MNRSDVQYIGKLSKLHGFKGAYVLISDSYLSQEIEEWESVFLEFEGLLVPFFINDASVISDNSALISFDDVTHEDRAKLFLNCSIYQTNKLFEKDSGPDSHNIIGYKVIDKKTGILGIVDKILDYNQNILLRVLYNNKEIMIPAAENILIDINHKKKIIQVDLPEGLLEIND